jgi:predicted enzyme related to lactoylglutathione lyase
MTEASNFIWYELMTPDPAGAAAFYGAVVGWSIASTGEQTAGGVDYRMIGRSDGGNAGGVLALNADMLAGGARPIWIGYLHVADVDAAVEAIKADGGAVQMAAMDIPVGRIAMVTDPSISWTPFHPRAAARATFFRSPSRNAFAGTNSRRATPMPRLHSTRNISAGARKARCRWANSAPIASSSAATSGLAR